MEAVLCKTVAFKGSCHSLRLAITIRHVLGNSNSGFYGGMKQQCMQLIQEQLADQANSRGGGIQGADRPLCWHNRYASLNWR